jgi:polyisoprenyl-phosphate glycosyltransferase
VTLVSIVVPTHNETGNVPVLYRRLAAVFQDLSGYDFELIFCDDSTDRTPDLICELHRSDARVKLVRLSRRFGQSIAIAAGVDRASGDAVIMMDADLQDPPEVLPRLIENESSCGVCVVFSKKRIQIIGTGEMTLRKRLFEWTVIAKAGSDVAPLGE